MKLKVNPIGYLLAQWDAFRTFGWINLVDEPEKLVDDVRTCFTI